MAPKVKGLSSILTCGYARSKSGNHTESHTIIEDAKMLLGATMIDVTQDIHSMTTFKRNSTSLMKRLKKTGRPLVLTVKGKAEAIILDPASYQDVADHLDAVAGIRRGLAEAKQGLGRSVDDVFDDLEQE